jgi:hypothetical protein
MTVLARERDSETLIEMPKHAILTIVVAALTLSSTACGGDTGAVAVAAPVSRSVLGDSDIALVRNGVLPDYDSTTVGKAFEGTFQNGKWSKFVTAKGRTVVQFDGNAKLQIPYVIASEELRKSYSKFSSECAPIANAKP